MSLLFKLIKIPLLVTLYLCAELFSWLRFIMLLSFAADDVPFLANPERDGAISFGSTLQEQAYAGAARGWLSQCAFAEGGRSARSGVKQIPSVRWKRLNDRLRARAFDPPASLSPLTWFRSGAGVSSPSYVSFPPLPFILLHL